MESMLPAFDTRARPARSAAAEFLEQLLAEYLPELEIVAIARRPGVQSKVAVLGTPVPIWRHDALARVRALLDGEQIQVIGWSDEPHTRIANALGLAEPAPMVLRPAIGHAHVLLGEIDLRGMNGWRGINRVLASALSGWRIHLESIAASPAWALVAAARSRQASVSATVVELSPRGPLVTIHGLSAWLPRREQVSVGQEVEVRVIRLDPDEGHIFVSRQLAPSGQLQLPRP
jgi:transcription antitermination factor NusA-like protein